MPPLHDSTTRIPVVVRLAGELDITTEHQLRTVLQRAVQVADGGGVLVHLDDVRFVDACTIRAFVDAADCAAARRQSLHVVATPWQAHLLRALDLERLLA